MIEPRVYRAAFVPALLARGAGDVLAPEPPAPAAPGTGRRRAVRRPTRRRAGRADRRPPQPDRRAGPAGRRGARPSWWRARSTRSGFRRSERQRFTHAGQRLVNVIGRRAGRSRRQIVVVAARDAARRAGRARQRRRHRRADRAGAGVRGPAVAQDARARLGRRLDARRGGRERLVSELGSRRTWSTRVLVVSDLGSPTRRGPSVQAWSNDSRRAGIGLQRTVAGLDPPGARTRAGGGAGVVRASSRGSPSRSASGRRACCSSERLRRGAHLGQRRAAAAGQRPGRGDRRGPARRARPRDAADGHGARPGPRPAHGPESLPARGEPGDARAGCSRCSPARCCCPCWWRRSTPSPARAAGTSRRAAVAALGRRLGRALPGRAGGRRAARAGRRHAVAAAGAGAARGAAARRARARRPRWAWRAAMLLALLLGALARRAPGRRA